MRLAVDEAGEPVSFLSIDDVRQPARASRIRGVQLAIVVDNKDGQGNPGYRVKLKFPWLNEQETTFWARIAVPMAGSGRGTYVLPDIDDQVLVVFEHGDIDRPIVVGSLWSKKQEPVENNQSGKNTTKLIKSRSGHRIIFDDKEGAEKIILVDQTKKNKIVLDSAHKVIQIESDGDLEIKAKTNFILHSNALKIGTKEGITGKGQSLLVHAQSSLGLKATSGITIGGGNTTINVSNAAATSVSGSGAGELGGAAAEQPKDPVEARRGGSGGGGSSSPGGGSSSPGGGSGNRGGSGGSPGGDPALPPIDLHEVEVRVVNVPGLPQAKVFFELTLPDGSKKADTTGSSGMIQFADIATPGPCRLVFPDLDDRLVAGTTASAPGRIRYVPGGVTVNTGEPAVVELQPLVRRGRLKGMLFETDKSFLLPSAMHGIRGLVRYYGEHPDLHVLVSGHADARGAEAYNLDLSVERATSIADFLTDNVDGWLPWYSAGTASKRWGTREDQYMLSALPDPATAFYTGPITGIPDAPSQQATRDFQTAEGLTVDGIAGPQTRRALIERYMALDRTSLPPGTPLEVHGCGEFHEEVPTPDGVASEDNRRVEVFLFEGPVDPPKRTPCPRPGCPEYPEWKRRTIETVDFRDDEPPPDPVVINPRWEAPPDPVLDDLVLTLFDRRRAPCATRQATVVLPDGRRIFGVTDGSGVLRVRIPSGTTGVQVRYTPTDSATLIDLAVRLGLGSVSDDGAAKQRLLNLGYPADRDLALATFQFQRDFAVDPASGQLDGPTRARLAAVHDGGGA